MRIAEADEDAVTDITRDIASPVSHHADTRIPVCAHRVREVLRVEVEGEFGGSNEIDKHHRKLAPLTKQACTSRTGIGRHSIVDPGSTLRAIPRRFRKPAAARPATRTLSHEILLTRTSNAETRHIHAGPC